VITDFGIPKVIGGNFNVLATDVFKLVIGQQDFSSAARWWRCCCWRRRVLDLRQWTASVAAQADWRCSPRAPCRCAAARARLRRADDGLLRCSYRR
jgi:hypothetical protein